jgi:hypothetical protein
MIIVVTLCASVEELHDRFGVHAHPPSVDALRPDSCPFCRHPAHPPQKLLGIVGHGTYTRQVLGHISVAIDFVIRVRRYLCRGCRRTISIFVDILHPRRWYSGAVILETLRLHLIEGRTELEIRKKFGPEIESESWRSLRRWRRQLLDPLWKWLGPRLGFGGPTMTREDGCRRLRRLLSEAGELQAERPDAGLAAAPRLTARTVHHRGISWPLGHDPPGILAGKSRPL